MAEQDSQTEKKESVMIKPEEWAEEGDEREEEKTRNI
jgi:hypothetical protein